RGLDRAAMDSAAGRADRAGLPQPYAQPEQAGMAAQFRSRALRAYLRQSPRIGRCADRATAGVGSHAATRAPSPPPQSLHLIEADLLERPLAGCEVFFGPTQEVDLLEGAALVRRQARDGLLDQ